LGSLTFQTVLDRATSHNATKIAIALFVALREAGPHVLPRGELLGS